MKSLMLELMRFQDKIYFKEKEAAVNMFKTKRRFFNGLREVLKYVKLKKIKVSWFIERRDQSGCVCPNRPSWTIEFRP